MDDSDILLKVVLLGATGTGKTTILDRLINPDGLLTDHKATIGVDFCSKKYVVNDLRVRCQVWDTAGQERYRSLLSSYLNSAQVLVFVYSVDDKSSFEDVQKLYEECKLVAEATVQACYLVGNKADLAMQRQVLRVDGEAFASSKNMKFLEICGREAKEVAELFHTLVHSYVSSQKVVGSSFRSFSRLNREKLDTKSVLSNCDSSRSLNLENRTSAATYIRSSQKIDANSNSVLIPLSQSARRSSNDADGSRLIQEIAHRLRKLEYEKDQQETEIESRIVKSSSQERDSTRLKVHFETTASTERTNLERCKDYEIQTCKNELNENKLKLTNKEAENERLQREIGILKLERDSLNRTITDERKTVEELKVRNQSLEDKLSKTSNESTSCEKEKLDLKNTVSILESTVKVYENEKEDLKSQYHKLNEHVTLLLNKFSSKFGVSLIDTQGLETLSLKIEELLNERAQASIEVSLAEKSVARIEGELKKKDEMINLLASNLQKQEQAVRQLQTSLETSRSEKKSVEIVEVEKIVEIKSNQSEVVQIAALEESVRKKQETIDRLVVNLNEHEKSLAILNKTLEEAKMQRDVAIQSQITLRTEMVTLNERYAKCKDEWLSNTFELDSRYGQLSVRDRSIKQLELDMELFKNNVDRFKVDLSQLLSDSVVKVGSDDTQIKESIKMLMNSSKERAQVIGLLQAEIERLNSLLNEKIDQVRQLEIRYTEFKMRCQDLEEKFCSSEISVKDLMKIREHLSAEHSSFESFVERASRILKLKLPVDDCEMLSELFLSELLAKIEQANNIVVDYEQEKKLNAKFNRVDDLKAQIANKDVHLDLLRKKVVDLEEVLSSRSESRRECDAKIQCQKKLQMKIQRQAEDIELLKCENTHLKSHVFDVKILNEKITEQESELKKRQHRIIELESIRDKYLVKLDHVKSELESTLAEFKRIKEINETSIQCLNKQLGDMKIALDCARFNEGKLTNFRECVANLLGVSSQFNCADHEMIARIEQIIRAVSVSVIPVQVKTVTTTIQTPRVVTCPQP